MSTNIDYSQAPPPTDSQSRRQLRFMIVFLQLICMPFFPLSLPPYPPLQAMVISVIGLGVICFGGNLLLWALSVPRRFSIRSAAIKALAGLLFFAIEYPKAHKEFVAAITHPPYTSMSAAQQIGQQHSLREEFDEAGRVVRQIGIEKVIRELESSGVSTEASQVLAVEAARHTKDARLKPFLKQIADGGGPVSKFAQAALEDYSP